MESLIYEERLKIGKFFKFIWIALGALFVIEIVYMLYQKELQASLVIGLTFIGVYILFFAVVPKKLQIFKDRIVVVCGFFKINMYAKDIEKIEILPPQSAYASMKGARFATANGQDCLLVKRFKKSSIIIQPNDTEKFIKVINQTFEIFVENN